MRFLQWKCDGGQESGVMGLFLIEIKPLFSIVLLRFKAGNTVSRFHTHAFHALTWWLWGEALETHYPSFKQIKWRPSLKPKLTTRSCFHSFLAERTTWALSIRGPWTNTWREFNPEGSVHRELTYGRKEVSRRSES